MAQQGMLDLTAEQQQQLLWMADDPNVAQATMPGTVGFNVGQTLTTQQAMAEAMSGACSIAPFPQQQQQQPQQPTVTDRIAQSSVGASISSFFAPLKMFGRGSSATRQTEQQQQQQPQAQTSLLAGIMPVTAMAPEGGGTFMPSATAQAMMQPLQTAAVPTLGAGMTSSVIKRNLFGGDKRELPQPPVLGRLVVPLPSVETVAVVPSIGEIKQSSYHQSFSEGFPSQDSGPSGGSGRMLPVQPTVAAGIVTTLHGAAKARERMKIRSSTWAEESAYHLPTDSLYSSSYRLATGTIGRRRQPIPPQELIKRPSSAGVLMTPTPAHYHTASTSGSAGSHQQISPYHRIAYGLQHSSQPRRITPPVPRARRKVPFHQHSIHSDGAAEIVRTTPIHLAATVDDDDDDDANWC